MKFRSIKTQLIVSVLLLELASALCGTGLTLMYERHAHFRAFDIMLRGRADSLLGAVQDAGDPQDHVMLDGTEIALPQRDIYVVWDENFRVLGHSSKWAGPPDAERLVVPSRQFQKIVVAGTQFRTIRMNGLRIVDPGDKGGGVPRRVTIVYGSPTGPVWNAIWSAVLVYGMISLLLVVLTGLGMFFLLRRGLAPLDELAMQAAGVSVTSLRFAPSDRIRKTTELAPLASALETAMQGLERSFTQQHRFVSDAAHELKTAVAVVKSSLQLLMMKSRTVSEYQAGLERCQADCARMENIVAKMLTLARVESSSGQTSGSATVFSTDMTKVIRNVAAQFTSFAEFHDLRINVSAPDVLILNMETEELELLCSNLLMNALQHSKAGDTVLVSARLTGTWSEIRIVDEGSGIEEELLPYIFDRFYRSDPSRSRRTGGTGLGLAICKAIVLKFHGTIEIKSKPGAGTTAVVRLPLEHDSIVWSDTARPTVLLEQSTSDRIP
jgi:signal transduction histidine kinase